MNRLHIISFLVASTSDIINFIQLKSAIGINMSRDEKNKSRSKIGSWDYLWQASAFVFACVFIFASIVGVFIYIVMSVSVGKSPFSSWGSISDLQTSLIIGLIVSFLIFSVLLTLFFTELYERIIFKPVKSLLAQMEKNLGYKGLADHVEDYLCGGSTGIFNLYNPRESWIDKVQEYVKTASNERYFDEITGCFNRKYFSQVLTETLRTQILCNIGELSKPKTNSSVCYCLYLIDIDHFKRINDEFGHMYGDQVLAQVGRTLRSLVGSDGVVVRNGGEEFLIIMCQYYPMNYSSFAEKIRKEFSETVFVKYDRTQEIRQVTCSVGYVPFPLYDDGRMNISVQQHVDFADQAMYLAKGSGRNTWRGILPVTMPRVPVEFDRICNSVDYGIKEGYIKVLRPEDTVEWKAAFMAYRRPGTII